MKKYTKKERNAIYKLARDLYTGEKDSPFTCVFLCAAIRAAVGIKYMNGRYAEIEISSNTFPELYAKKPKDKEIGDAWFCGDSERLAAINACIKETE